MRWAMGEGRCREIGDDGSKVRVVGDIGVLVWCVVDRLWGGCAVLNDEFGVWLYLRGIVCVESGLVNKGMGKRHCEGCLVGENVGLKFWEIEGRD